MCMAFLNPLDICDNTPDLKGLQHLEQVTARDLEFITNAAVEVRPDSHAPQPMLDSP
jgi:hypothetical protein